MEVKRSNLQILLDALTRLPKDLASDDGHQGFRPAGFGLPPTIRSLVGVSLGETSELAQPPIRRG